MIHGIHGNLFNSLLILNVENLRLTVSVSRTVSRDRATGDAWGCSAVSIPGAKEVLLLNIKKAASFTVSYCLD